MAQIKQKIEKFIFNGKMHATGNFGFRQFFSILVKIIKLRGWGAVFAYARFVFLPKKASLKTPPFVVACYVDSRCNLRCPYCCFGIPEASQLRSQYDFEEILSCRDMTLEDFKKLAANKLFKKSLALVLSGGEPTLNRDLFAIINYAKDYFPMIHLTTNGTMLGAYMDKIPDSGLTHINISLDAPDIEEYKKMRVGEGGELVFEKVTENVKKLFELKKNKNLPLQIVISSVSGKLNYKKMGEMIEFGRSLGADSVNLQNICGFNCEALSNQTIMAEDAEIMQYIKNLQKKYSDYNVAWPRICSADKSIRGCRQPFDSITLDADGNVGPCSVMVPKSNSKFGNILRDEGVWNNEEYIKLRASLLDNSRPLGSKFCRDCTFLHGDTY